MKSLRFLWIFGEKYKLGLFWPEKCMEFKKIIIFWFWWFIRNLFTISFWIIQKPKSSVWLDFGMKKFVFFHWFQIYDFYFFTIYTFVNSYVVVMGLCFLFFCVYFCILNRFLSLFEISNFCFVLSNIFSSHIAFCQMGLPPNSP